MANYEDPIQETESINSDPVQNCVRDDLIAFFSGILCFPVAFFLKSWLLLWFNPAVITLLPILCMATAGAVIVFGVSDYI